MLTALAGMRATLAQVVDMQGTLAQDVAALKLASADDVSFVSPTGKQYEELVDSKINDWLKLRCGLQVVEGSRRGIAATDPSAANFQWDARFSVKCDPDWTAPARSGDFLVYGGSKYLRPAVLPTLRELSPTKFSAAAEYFAVLEYTRFPGWTEEWESSSRKRRTSLLPRLEQRLLVCIQRAKAAGVSTSSVLDVVALVGVVSDDTCKESVEALLSKVPCDYPAIQEMFRNKRFVFFYFAPMLPVGPPVMAEAAGELSL